MNYIPVIKRRPRVYNVLISEAGRKRGYANWPGSTWSGRPRIHAAAISIHRRWFGIEPNFSWGADGFMAATRDKRGNEVQLEQENGKWAIQKYQSQEAA